MSSIPPYMVSSGLIPKILAKIQEARRPDRFTQDFLETKLGFSGGSAMAAIPFLKRTGFLSSDGSPTELYDMFRNADTQGLAAANALRTGYKELFDRNEYVYELAKDKLEALVVQTTGMERDNRAVKAISSSFAHLKSLADFEAKVVTNPKSTVDQEVSHSRPEPPKMRSSQEVDLRLSYTINLNLPETTNADVFNAIFKSLKEHLLKD